MHSLSLLNICSYFFNENMTQNMIQSTARDLLGFVCKNLYFPSIRLKEKEYKIDSYHLEILCFESCKCHCNIKSSIYLILILHVSHKLLCNTAQLQKNISQFAPCTSKLKCRSQSNDFQQHSVT